MPRPSSCVCFSQKRAILLEGKLFGVYIIKSSFGIMILKNEARNLKNISLGQTDYPDYFNKLHPILKGYMYLLLQYVLDKCGKY